MTISNSRPITPELIAAHGLKPDEYERILSLIGREPTFTELGYPEVETHAWFGLFLPAGSPTEAVQRIYLDSKKIIEESDFRQKQLVEKGYEVVGSSPAEFVNYLKKDRESRGRAVKVSGAKAE